VTQAAPAINESPNAYARAPRLILGPKVALVSGYQSFTAFEHSVIPDPQDRSLSRKQELLAPHFTTELLGNRTLLDLGANNAFFSLWGLCNRAAGATAVDMDPQCRTLVSRVAGHLGYRNLRLVEANIQEQCEPADVVLALALVHWVYSCTADFGSLDAVIGWLASLSRHALIVEWIAPHDSAIAGHHHTDFNRQSQREPYTYAAFRAALAKYFPSVTYLGHVTDTRSLFMAKKTAAHVDLAGPLPLLHDASTILSSRFLESAGSLQFWSRVYDLGDSILKQSSFDLASREAFFLNQLRGPHFPRAGAATATGGYSTVRLEKIFGQPLKQSVAAGVIGESAATMLALINSCLDILDELAGKEIRHRDIHPGNILIRDGGPVLLDFGWAVSPTAPYYTPLPLIHQPPHQDVIGMAEVMAAVAGGRYPAIAPILGAMSNPDPNLALTSTTTLRALFHKALTQPPPPPSPPAPIEQGASISANPRR
jgi:hypothetical protein